MFHAYIGTADYEGESEEQAAAEIGRTFAGGYGLLNAAGSQVFEQEGRILSATLVTTWQGRPFVAFSMTHPEAKNRGLAGTCMRAAMSVLVSQGHRELRLVVTRANAPALALYTRLGFEVERDA
jgi:ribosomal protein S18 acetylase RimI-like enzyme